MPQTRSDTSKFGIGQPCQLPSNQLPQKVDILRAFLCHNNLMGEGKVTSVKKELISSRLSGELIEIWCRASVPTIEKIQVTKMICRLWEKYADESRNSTQKSISSTIGDSNELFDICSCPCFKPKFGKRPKVFDITKCCCLPVYNS